MNYMKLPVIILVTLFYALALVVDRSAGVLYTLLLLVALTAIVVRAKPEGKSFICLVKEYWPLMLAMAAPLIAVFIRQLVMGTFSHRSYDSQSRLAMFTLVFWVMLLVPLKHIRWVQLGWVVGVLLSAVKIYELTKGGNTRYSTDFLPIITFAELILLMAVFTAFSISWDKSRAKLLAGLKLLILGVGMYAAYLSQSRGVWATIPVFAIIACISVKSVSTKHKIGVAVLFAVCLGALFCHSDILKERVDVAESDIHQYLTGSKLDTSLGTRFQLWHGSWILFKENPLVGVGMEGFRDAIEELAERDIITAGSAAYAHSHNEILFMMVRLGVFGLAAILAVYFVPAFYFFREMRHPDHEIRAAASMGAAVSLGFFTLGLVDVVFLWWESYPYYAISIALFLAYIIKRKNALAQQAAGQQILD